MAPRIASSCACVITPFATRPSRIPLSLSFLSLPGFGAAAVRAEPERSGTRENVSAGAGANAANAAPPSSPTPRSPVAIAIAVLRPNMSLALLWVAFHPRVLSYLTAPFRLRIGPNGLDQGSLLGPYLHVPAGGPANSL